MLKFIVWFFIIYFVYKLIKSAVRPKFPPQPPPQQRTAQQQNPKGQQPPIGSIQDAEFEELPPDGKS